MLIEPRHDLNKIARPGAIIELSRENTIPTIPTRTGRSRQAEDECRAGYTCGGATLNRRCSDFGMAEQMKRNGKPIHTLFKQRLDRFWRDIAAGKPCPTCGDDRIDRRIG